MPEKSGFQPRKYLTISNDIFTEGESFHMILGLRTPVPTHFHEQETRSNTVSLGGTAWGCHRNVSHNGTPSMTQEGPGEVCGQLHCGMIQHQLQQVLSQTRRFLPDVPRARPELKKTVSLGHPGVARISVNYSAVSIH